MDKNSFGARLRYFRRRARDPERGGPVTQERLTHLLFEVCGLEYSYAAVSDWERGKSQISKDHRATLVGLIMTLGRHGGILSRLEADEWLETANYRALNTEELAEVREAGVAWHDLPEVPDEHEILEAMTMPPRSAPMMAPPLPPHAIIGREELLDIIKDRLLARQFVTVSAVRGLPGVGKTTLALALAHDAEIRAAFPDGVLWTGLGRDPDIFFHLGLWGQALGLADGELGNMTAVGMRSAAVSSLLRNRSALLIIDDAWHAKHAQWFRLGGKACAHVITTRLPAVGNAIPGAKPTVVDTLSDESSVQLLRLLAPQVYEQFPDEVRGLAISSSGLPLALVLMGNYLRQQAATGQRRRVVRALQDLQDQSFRFRVEMHQTGVHPHPSLSHEQDTSLSTIIGISEQALPGQGVRDAFRCLGVFRPKPNSFSEEAAMATTRAEVETLDELVDAGLVEPAGQERYQIHQAISQYLVVEGASEEAQQRFIQFYADWLSANKDDFPTVGREQDNIMTAATLALELDLHAPLIEIVKAYYPFLESRALWEVVDTLLPGAVELSLQSGDHLSAIDILRQEGRSWEVRRDRERADACWERALKLAREQGETDLLVSLLSDRSIAASAADRDELAREYLEEALTISRRADYKRGMGLALGYLGRLEYQAGDYTAATTHLDEAIDVARENAMSPLLCGLLILRGVVATYSESADSAEHYYLEALPYARTVGRTDQLSAILTNLGEIETKRGRDARATAYLEEALEIVKASGSKAREAHIRKDLGILAMREGYGDIAEQHFDVGLQLARADDNQWLSDYIEVHWGELALQNGDWVGAESIFSRLVSSASDSGKYAYIRAIALYGMAQIAQQQGRISAAERDAIESERLLQEMGHERAFEVSTWHRSVSERDASA